MQNALLQWDAEGMPYSLQYGDVYYSKADALGESSHVFVQGNDLPQRFAALPAAGAFVVGELGFGAGLNFLNTCRTWCDNAPVSARLYYLACELHPFLHIDLQRLLSQFPLLQPYAEELLRYYPDHTPGVHQFTLYFTSSHQVTLTLLYGDAVAVLEDYLASKECSVDAWFFDGFAPRVNPALWQVSLLQLVARTCRAGTTLTSYSVAGSFRAALQQSGFSFTRLAGYGGKRHMLQATYEGSAAGRATRQQRGTVCVAGGGLAGCSTAYSLAQAGWQVILLEQAETLATGGSGNPQGILHCKPATADTLDNHFNLHAYLHAQRHYSALQQHRGLDWHQCGMLHVGFNAEQQKRFTRVLDSGRYSAAILQRLEPDEASAIAGVTIDVPCLYFPRSGWLNPAALCRLYTRHSHIRVYSGHKVQTLQRQQQCWQIETLSSGGNEVFTADAVVLCNGADAYAFPQCRALPIISNRGQVDVYAGTAATEVSSILCGQGYVLPSSNGMQSIGGSYFVEGTSKEQNRRLHLELLQRMQPALAASFAERTPLQQRVAQRCQTPDRMPLVGAVDAAGSPGLYINIGHGSNGLARTPLSAAVLASVLSGTPSPLEGRLRPLLDPARFTA